uniref:Putative alpha toxin Tx629 n=1 Tax=Buthus israelis TaxID=2899555 RepID=B8XGZ1_BUTIS|nr:putative alpha toxin Tx629 [Buthus occitanus israelis]
MNHLVMISLALLLMTGGESVRNGFIAEPHNCPFPCVPPICYSLCKQKGASMDCKWLPPHGKSCWCNGLPNNVPIVDKGK